MTGEPDFTPGPAMSLLDDAALDRLTAGHCPQCGYRGFVIGPRGGMAINIECGDVSCRSRYNVTFYAGRAVMAHDLFDGRSAVPWPSEPPSAH